MAKPLADRTLERAVEQLKKADALGKHGLHEEESCNAETEEAQEQASATELDLGKAIGDLHRQAHPGENRLPMYCHLEPCRSLDVQQYREAAIA